MHIPTPRTPAGVQPRDGEPPTPTVLAGRGLASRSPGDRSAGRRRDGRPTPAAPARLGRYGRRQAPTGARPAGSKLREAAERTGLHRGLGSSSCCCCSAAAKKKKKRCTELGPSHSWLWSPVAAAWSRRWPYDAGRFYFTARLPC
jgi:hypothetical protein